MVQQFLSLMKMVLLTKKNPDSGVRVVMNAQEELFKILGGEIPERLRGFKMSREEKLEALKKLEKSSKVDLKIRK